MKHILVTGANGQIGSELVTALGRRYGREHVVSSDLRPPPSGNGPDGASFPHEVVDVVDREALRRVIEAYDIDAVFHLASLLSVTGEKKPDLAWRVNLEGLKHVLDLAIEYELKVFWPSSIAVFGPDTPKEAAPQLTVLDPSTIYGITKVTGELLCNYYYEKYGVDVRSVRYPGIISYLTHPGGGTTDYAVEVFFAAAEGRPYTCFVRPDTRLPMMYMPDAIKATLDLMHADPKRLGVRSSYNIGAISFTADELVREIRARVPGFVCRYEPDERQQIADSWPASVDDTRARQDWGWAHSYDLPAMAEDMLAHLMKPNAQEV